MADWEKIRGRIRDWSETVAVTAQRISRMKQYHDLFNAPREQSQNLVAQMVQTQGAEVLRRFEEEFIEHSLQVFSPAERLRTIELYAWFKYCEACRCNGFQGFITQGERL